MEYIRVAIQNCTVLRDHEIIYSSFSIFIFPGYITNQFNNQFLFGFLAQLVSALHRYRRGQGSNPSA